MTNTHYHHGNLRESLIKAGLKIINEEGEKNLSMRKVATLCGVSHSAPKSHFSNKDEFIDAIKKEITKDFSLYMTNTLKNNMDSKNLIFEFGLSYVKYFIDNPDSFFFIINQEDLHIEISKDKIEESTYPPFQIFQSHATEILLKSGCPENKIPAQILSLWAFVNGIAGLTVMKGFTYNGDWMEMVKSMLRTSF